MASVFEVMAKLSGNSAGMVGAFKQAAAAAEEYKSRVSAATKNAVDATGAETHAKLAGSKGGEGFASGFKGAIAGLGAVAATVGLAGFIKEAAAASDATDKFKATMSFAGLKTDAIDNAQKAAKRFADQTVYDLPTIQNTVAQLASNGIKDYTGLTQAAGNLNAVAGGNAETFKSVAMMMTQTAGAGKLTTENWNQLSDAIPGAAGPLMNALKEAGAYTGNFREAMEKGQITSDEFNAALMKLGTDPIAVEAAKSTKTFEGAIGSLQATINSGLMGALNAIKPAATGAINGLATGLGAVFGAFGATYQLLKTGDFNGAIRDALHVEEDSPVITVLLKVRDLGKEVAGGFRAMGAAWKDNNGDVTSSGFAGVMEEIANGAHKAFDVLSNFKYGVKGMLDPHMFDGIADGPYKTAALLGDRVHDQLVKMVDNFKATAGQIGPAIAPAFGSLGESFLSILPSLVTLVSSLSPVGLALTALTPVIPILAGAAAQLAASLGGALAQAVNAVAPVLATIVTAVADGVTWFMSLDGAADALAAGITTVAAGLAIYKGVMTAITVATRAWAIVQGVLNAVMAINPVTLIIIGIGLLVAAIVLLVANWDNVVSFITQIWGGFLNWMGEVMGGFANWLQGIWDAVVAGITAWVTDLFAPVVAGFNAFLAFVGVIWGAVSAAISAAWGAIVSWVSGAVAAVVNPIVDGFNAMVGFITSIFNAITGFIVGVWTWVWNLLVDIAQTFWAENGAAITAGYNFIVGIFTSILDFIVSVWTAVANAVMGAVNWVVQIISDGFTAAYNWVSSILSTIWAFIVSIWTQVSGFISGVMTAIGAAIAAAWNWITGIISGALSAVWGVITSVFTAVWGFISGIFNTVAGFVSGIWNQIASAVGSAAQRVWSVVSSAFNAVWGTVTSVFNNVASFIGGIWNGIVSGISGAVGQIGGVIGSIYGKVTGALSGAASWLVSAGQNIVQGLINGVTSLAGTIGQAFLNTIPGWIVEPFKRAMGIASPSKLFRQFGRWIVQGLGHGVTLEKGTAVGAMQDAAAAVTSAGSGITLDAPVIPAPAVPVLPALTVPVPKVPDLGKAIELPELTQVVRLKYVGTPAEAMANLAASVAATGPDGYLVQADSGSGYNGASLAALNGVQGQQAPQINVTVQARVTNPFTQEEVEAIVTDVATAVSADALSGTARVANNSRTGGQAGF